MISMNWIKDYVNLDGEDLKTLAVKITKAGFNIEQVISKHIDNLVVGEVLECENHPDSDHLHVCKVNIGSEVIQIVCGASNVRKGIKVIVAKVGAILPGDFEIKKGMIRGVESSGMICALFELGLEEKTEETYAKGIEELDNDAPVGMDAMEYLGVDDTLYDLDYHKRRNNDCYYHIGFAYEVATILGKKVTLPESKYDEIKENVNDYMRLSVETDKCPYYIGKMVKNVKIGESPDWIKKRLISAGMRPINNVVDISNFVMLEYGQPTHFFDYDKLGNKILVRNALDNEEITTLDGVNRTLTSKDIVITNGDKPTCIAGVMGGENTEIDSNTQNIFIESAIFDSVSIRNTANRLNLKSEASIRYGKGLNYEYTKMAIDRCCYLLSKYADATICSGEVIHDTLDKKAKVVSFKASEVNKLLGIDIDTESMQKQLDRLGFEQKLENDTFTVIIPNRRLDIEPNINDIAEEIGRLYGYHNLVSKLPKVSIKRGTYIGDVGIRKDISKRLRSLGLNETKNYTLVSSNMASLFKYETKEQIALPNPMSMDKSIVRTSLLPSLLNVYEYNKARKVKDVNIYEIAKTYDKDYNEDVKVAILMKGDYVINNYNGSLAVDFYLIKGIVENLLDYLGLKNRYTFITEKNDSIHPYISASILVDREKVGIIGKVSPLVNKDDIYVAEISMTKINKPIKPLKYKEVSKYPLVKRDLAFIVSKDISCSTLMDQIKKSGGRLLTDIDVFDVYTGENVKENEKSIAFTLTFSDNTRTLSEEEITEVFNKIINEVENKCDAKVRDK